MPDMLTLRHCVVNSVYYQPLAISMVKAVVKYMDGNHSVRGRWTHLTRTTTCTRYETRWGWQHTSYASCPASLL